MTTMRLRPDGCITRLVRRAASALVLSSGSRARSDPSFKAPRQPANEAGATRERLDLDDDGDANDYLEEVAKGLADEVYIRGTEAVVITAIDNLGVGWEAEDEEPEPGVIVNNVRLAKNAFVLTKPSCELIEYMAEKRFAFFRPGKNEPRAIRCRPWLSKRLLGTASRQGFRPIEGIITQPLIRKGEVIAITGYDAPTRSYMHANVALPKIPDTPTRKDALEAMERALGPFQGYLKEGEAGIDNKVAILTAVLTAILRPSILNAPFILVDANVPAAGKGLLARALA
jgi:hypothetical protein